MSDVNDKTIEELEHEIDVLELKISSVRREISEKLRAKMQEEGAVPKKRL